MSSAYAELEEAADINGANFWQRMGKIVLPLAKNWPRPRVEIYPRNCPHKAVIMEPMKVSRMVL